MKNFTLKNKLYDVLKFIVTVVSPALITLITALTMAWGWNIPLEAIVTTIAAVTAFIGAILGISSSNYKKLQEGA